MHSDEDLVVVKQAMNNQVEIPINDDWETQMVDTWRVGSVFEHKNQESGSTFWHLHPELVDNDEETGNCTTMLCHNCTTAVKKNKIPDLSIACGLDFGYHRWIKGLVEPNLQEQLILAKTRMYFAVMKATSNSHGASKDFDARCMARVHAILFPHNAPEVATYLYNPKLYEENGLLDLAHLKHQMHIFFVTDKGESDRLASAVFGSAQIVAPPWVTAQWLLVLKRTNKLYSDIDVSHVTRINMEELF